MPACYLFQASFDTKLSFKNPESIYLRSSRDEMGNKLIGGQVFVLDSLSLSLSLSTFAVWYNTNCDWTIKQERRDYCIRMRLSSVQHKGGKNFEIICISEVIVLVDLALEQNWSSQLVRDTIHIHTTIMLYLEAQ